MDGWNLCATDNGTTHRHMMFRERPLWWQAYMCISQLCHFNADPLKVVTKQKAWWSLRLHFQTSRLCTGEFSILQTLSNSAWLPIMILPELLVHLICTRGMIRLFDAYRTWTSNLSVLLLGEKYIRFVILTESFCRVFLTGYFYSL